MQLAAAKIISLRIFQFELFPRFIQPLTKSTISIPGDMTALLN